MNYQHIMRQAMANPWAILPAKLSEIMAFLALKAAGGTVAPAEVAEIRASKSDAPRIQVVERIGIVPLRGTIVPRANLVGDISKPGGASAELFVEDIRTLAADPNISAIILDVDSPGGNVVGIPEAAAAVLEARAKKPVVAVVGGMAASAAYWIIANATEIVLPIEGQVGSIGVFTGHEDMSEALKREGVKVTLISAGKYKTEGSPYEPLSEEARADMQLKVDKLYDLFVDAVAQGRGVSSSKVKSGFGEGRMILAKDAVAAGMADRIGTMRSTLIRLMRTQGSGASARASIVTVRDFETHLRDELGFSGSEAKRIAADGFKAPEPREAAAVAEVGAMDPETRQALRDFVASVNK